MCLCLSNSLYLSITKCRIFRRIVISHRSLAKNEINQCKLIPHHNCSFLNGLKNVFIITNKGSHGSSTDCEWKICNVGQNVWHPLCSTYRNQNYARTQVCKQRGNKSDTAPGYILALLSGGATLVLSPSSHVLAACCSSFPVVPREGPYFLPSQRCPVGGDGRTQRRLLIHAQPFRTIEDRQWKNDAKNPLAKLPNISIDVAELGNSCAVPYVLISHCPSK